MLILYSLRQPNRMDGARSCGVSSRPRRRHLPRLRLHPPLLPSHPTRPIRLPSRLPAAAASQMHSTPFHQAIPPTPLLPAYPHRAMCTMRTFDTRASCYFRARYALWRSTAATTITAGSTAPTTHSGGKMTLAVVVVTHPARRARRWRRCAGVEKERMVRGLSNCANAGAREAEREGKVNEGYEGGRESALRARCRQPRSRARRRSRWRCGCA
ncbi:hypothetical protein C8R45DRAFT_477846 [Mycena sanguinolenta]|nr:hypothetical protein C8R45DRAFT_477846 [Mycena sanguinolenta]